MNLDLPLMCPHCSALVRHNWGTTCGACGEPLINEPEPQVASDADDLAVNTPSTSFNFEKKTMIIGGIGVFVVLALLSVVALKLSSSGAEPTDVSALGVTTTTSKATTTTTTAKPASIEDIAHNMSVGASTGFFAGAYPANADTPDGLLKTNWSNSKDTQCHASIGYPWTTTAEDKDNVHTVTSSNDDLNMAFAMICTDSLVGKKASDSDLKTILNQFSSGASATVESQTIKTNLGVRQLDAQFKAADGQGQIRIFQGSNGTLYMLMAIANDDLSSLSDKFFSGFQTFGA